jgi:uncharacterized membrane protein
MWFFLALVSAIFIATSDLFSKFALKDARVATVATVRPLWACVFLLPFCFFAAPPTNPTVFWSSIAVALPLEVLAGTLYYRAIKSSPLSLVIPFMAFTPVFLMAIAWGFLKEAPSTHGVLGVACVTGGAFFLQAKSLLAGPGALVRHLKSEKGIHCMLGAAMCYAITATFAKRALLASSPFYFTGLYFGLLSVAFLPLQMRSPQWKQELFANTKVYAAMGLFEGISSLCLFMAFIQVKAAYAISVKRLSLLIAVFYGHLFFKEEDVLSRLIGAGFMVAGAILLAFA